jgi:hypothetical protein
MARFMIGVVFSSLPPSLRKTWSIITTHIQHERNKHCLLLAIVLVYVVEIIVGA